MKLTKAEQRIYDEAAAGLLAIPKWLDHRLKVYARCYYAWEKMSGKLRRTLKSPDDVADLYKISGVSAVLLKQVESAFNAIDRERARQDVDRKSKLKVAEMGEDPLAEMEEDAA